MIEANSPAYRFMVWVAIAMGVFFILSMAYQHIFIGEEPGNRPYREGHLRLEDEQYDRALSAFDENLAENPGNAPGLLGRGLALSGLGRVEEAFNAFDAALEVKPDMAAAYANRGILNDKIGQHEKALADYKEALRIDPSLGEGPGWLTRFFRSQWDPPPTIATRAAYIEAELEKPPQDRLLRLPELDDKQRGYRVSGK